MTVATWGADTVPLSYENRELRGAELPGTQFLVHDRIPYGVWMHSAPAGGYKSAFAAQIEHHIAYGTPIPGLDWEFAQHGDCLVISPDETAYEMQDRTLRILPGGRLETDGAAVPDPSLPDIHVRHETRGENLELRIAWLLAEIERLEERTGRHVVWVRWDTMGNLLGDKNGVDHYTHSQPLQRLNQIMANNNRVMFIPNHVGKDGRSIGSVNLTACSNISTKATITKSSNTGVITCLEDDTKMRGGRGWSAAVSLRDGLLDLIDESPQEAGHQLGSMPHTVAAFLAKCGPSTVAELRAGTGIPDKPLWKCILRLKAKSEIARRDDARWLLQETGGVSHWPAEQPAAVAPPEPEAVPAPVPAPRPAPEQPAAAAPAAPVEPVPQLAANEALDRLRILVRDSELYARPRLQPETRAKLGYENVCVGGSPNRYQMFPEQAPAGPVLILDRKAAYYQSCATWYVPNVLHREGDLDHSDIVRRSLAGMFEIVFTPRDPSFQGAYPDPLGGLELERGSRLLVPRATLDRVMDSVRAGYRREPSITYGLCGKGTERGPLYQWGKWCLDQRRKASDREQLAEMKEAQNQAFGTLRIADPDKSPGPVDRPDWQYAAIGHHYATINRYVWASLDAGEPCIAAGNTDEIIYAIPHKAPADWVPESMRAHIEAGRFAVKDRRDGGQWFENPRALHG